MPNHITNVVTITGPAADLAACLVRHIVEKTTPKKTWTEFDFETLIPMPQSVKDTIRDFENAEERCGDAQVSLYALALMHNRREFIAAGERPGNMPKTVERWSDAIAWLDKEHPAAAKWGRRALLCAGETGYPGWYEWSIANWGTKWGSYDYAARPRDGLPGSFEFQTAWAPPRPIFEALSKTWPALTFDVEAIDEGGWEYVARYVAGAGEIKDVPHDLERYRRVYGRDPYRGEDDDDEAVAAGAPAPIGTVPR